MRIIGGGLLIAAGVLSILGGIPQIISGGVLIADVLAHYQHGFGLLGRFFLPSLPDGCRWYILFPGPTGWSTVFIPPHWPILGASLAALGIVAVIGGISAIKGRRFGLSLAGAICALPSVFLGIAAVILVALGKREFRVKT